MPAKATIFLTFLVLTAQIAVAAPPACLIAAVNEQPEPSNTKAVCSGSNATEVTNLLCKNCGEQRQAALDDFEDACLGVGLDISVEDACSSKSQTNSGMHTATRSGSGTSTATTTTDATSSASQSAGSAEGSNAAVDAGFGSGGITAALLFAALVAGRVVI